MSKITGFIKRHRALTILFIVLVVVAIIVVSCVSNINKALSQVTDVAPNVTVLSPATLENIVTATGTLESTDIRQVTTTQVAEVETVFVQVGDTVQAGDLLCVLDSTSVDKSLSNAEEDAALANATDALGYNQANRAYNEAKEQYDKDLSDADKDVRTAKDALNDITNLAKDTAEARSNLAALVSARESTYADLELARETYGEEGDEYWEAIARHDEAYQAAEAAERVYDEVYNGFAAEIAAAQAAYDGAVGARDTVVRQNEGALNTARDALERQALSDSAREYERRADSYRDEKDEMSIYAPISGRVTAVNAEVGVSAAGFAATATGTAGLSSGLFEIQNTSSMQIVTSVAEYDVVLLENGMDVSITSDAMAGETWTGVVSSISPTATDINANFEVIVTVTSDPGILVPGMSARMSIIVESEKDVFAVPFDAVVTNEAGEQVVYAYEPGGEGTEASRREIVVGTGVENDYYIQIISPELEEGMQILNDPLGVNVNAAFNMFGI